MWIRINRACGQTARWLGEYLDGTLPLRRRRAVDAHLLACAACRRELDTLRRTLALVTSLPPRELSADFETTLRARLAAARPGRGAASRSRWSAMAFFLFPALARERYLRAPWPSPIHRLAPAGVIAAAVVALAVRNFQPALVTPPSPRPAPAYVTALVQEHQLLSAGSDMNDTVVRHNLDSDLLGDGDQE